MRPVLSRICDAHYRFLGARSRCFSQCSKTRKYGEDLSRKRSLAWASIRRVLSFSPTSGVATSRSKTAAAFPPETPRSYEVPRAGLLSLLPASWVPYAELIRLTSPAGTIYLFFPCLFSTLLAAPLTSPPVAPAALLSTSALFLTGALVMRGAGCTINDLWDRQLDAHVARTRLRPLARGAVTPRAAVAYVGAQLLVGLGVLLQLPQPACFLYATPSLLLVATYPLAKRVTHYPQLVLGLTFSWGALMGFPALGIDLVADGRAAAAAGLLYASCAAWTVLYDMIYAHMDLRDDARAGIKSIAVKHGGNTRAVLTGLAAVQLGLLASAGAVVGAGPAFYAGSCGAAAAALGTMICRVDLQSVASCWWWFRHGAWLTGGAISLGLFVDYLDRGRAKPVPDEMAGDGEPNAAAASPDHASSHG